jgi:CelD/BcsL family acetyltransferase involved in cellulose biosynthesis
MSFIVSPKQIASSDLDIARGPVHTNEVTQCDGFLFRTFHGLKGLDQLAAEWTGLVQTLPRVSFNQLPEWYRAYLTSGLSNPDRIIFVAAYRDQALVAVFPLQFQSLWSHVLEPRVLGTIDHDQLQLSDFVFAQTKSNSHLLFALTHWLRHQRTLRWDELRLRKIADDSSVAFSARARLPEAAVALQHDWSAYVDTSSTFEHATKAMTSKFKRNLRRRLRLAEEKAQVRFQSYRSPGELADAFAKFLQIEASDWKGASGTSTAISCQPDMLRFYQEVIREFSARDDGCVINLLWHGDQAVAGNFCLRVGRTLHLLKVGFRNVHAIFAPGILLSERTIQHACQDPDIDVLSFVNHPSWGYGFKPRTMAVWSYCAPNWGVRGMLVHIGLLLKRKWDSRASKAAEPSTLEAAE